MKQLTSTDRVVIVGGSGFLGLNLARHLAQFDCDVVVISRNAPKQEGPWQHAVWDAREQGDWATHLDGARAVVNLAGRSVDCIKTPDHCDEILRSRVDTTLLLGKAIQYVASPPPVWVQMSTAHIYGDPPDARCDEDAAFGYGLAPFVARAWEDAFASVVPAGMRQVILRTSFVFGASWRRVAAARNRRPHGFGGQGEPRSARNQLDSRAGYGSLV